jgi:hypothetical protein
MRMIRFCNLTEAGKRFIEAWNRVRIIVDRHGAREWRDSTGAGENGNHATSEFQKKPGRFTQRLFAFGLLKFFRLADEL